MALMRQFKVQCPSGGSILSSRAEWLTMRLSYLSFISKVTEPFEPPAIAAE